MIKNIAFAFLCALLVIGCKKDRRTLYVYTWADYISPELIQQFEEENNCTVVIDTFDSNETLLAKLLAGAGGYDVIMPTEYFMPILTKHNLIDTLCTNLLPNVVKNIDTKFSSEWTLSYDVPYAFSCAGILWRKDKVPADLKFNDWKDLFDKRLEGRICMMNDIREVLGIALKVNGFSVNSTNEAELAAAVKTARDWKSRCAKLDNESYRTGIPSGEFYAAMSYNSDAIMLLADDDTNIGYSVPSDGTTSSIDVFCILKSAANKDLAHKFIDSFYILENAVENAEYNGVPMPIKNVFNSLSDQYKSIPFMQVTDELKSKCEDIRDVGDGLKVLSKAWDKVIAK